MRNRKQLENKRPFVRLTCLMLACVLLCPSLLTGVGAVGTGTQGTDAESLLPAFGGIYKQTRGMTYEGDGDAVRLTGTPTQSSYVDLLGSKTEIPQELKTGDRLHLDISSGTNYVALGIRAFNAANPDGVWLVKTSGQTDFTVPELTGYTGVAVRILTVQTDRSFQMTVYPRVTVIERAAERNVLPALDGLHKQTRGMTYEGHGDAVRLTGTPTQSSYVDLLGSKTEIPQELKPGDKLHLNISSGTNYVALGIRAFTSANSDGVWLVKTSEQTDFTVPDLTGYTGVAVRILTVQTDRSFEMDVYPRVTVVERAADRDLLSHVDGLSKQMRGIRYSFRDGTVHLTGTPTQSSFLDLLGSSRSIPKELQAGERIKLCVSSGTNYVFFGIIAFNRANPSGKWLVKATRDTEFVIPDLSEYTGVAVRVHVVKQDKELDMTLPVSLIRQGPATQKRYLTIIDDDGDIHYKTDLIPFIQRVGVPISSAVTPTRIGTYSRWMSWDDILYCDQMGGEILCHMYNHYTGTQMQSVSNETLLSEFRQAEEIFRQRGLESGRFLVYSSSTGNMTRVQEVAAKVFSCGIKIGGNAVNYPSSNRFALTRFRIDYAETEGRKDWSYEDMLSYVDQITENGGWGIWMIHTSNPIYRQRVVVDSEGRILLDASGNPIPMVDSNGDPVLDTKGQYPTVGSTVLLPMLERAIRYAQSQGVEIVTVKQGYEAFYQE